MCLDINLQEINENERFMEVVGYKVFRFEDGNLLSIRYTDKKYCLKFKPYVVINDDSDYQIYSQHFSYLTGFHVFSKLEDAQKLQKILFSYYRMPYVIHRVELSDLIAKGQQEWGGWTGASYEDFGEYSDICYVGRRITVLEEVK